MISKLTGLLESLDEDGAVIDVGGVGYQVFCSTRTLREMPAVGQTARCYVDTQMSEDAIRLFGFAEEREREWFKLLRTVQGVGAKVALALLGVLDPDGLAQAIATEDKAALGQANGVGARLAARLIGELKDKVTAPSGTADPTRFAGLSAAEPQTADAVSALVNLGYRPSEAHGAVASAVRNLGDQAGVEILIREGLKELTR